MWVDFKKEKPIDGSKCLVVFEQDDGGGDLSRWMNIDLFDEGSFAFLINWDDQCSVVGLPAGSVISRCRAICWMYTDIDPKPLSFDLFG